MAAQRERINILRVERNESGEDCQICSTHINNVYVVEREGHEGEERRIGVICVTKFEANPRTRTFRGPDSELIRQAQLRVLQGSKVTPSKRRKVHKRALAKLDSGKALAPREYRLAREAAGLV